MSKFKEFKAQLLQAQKVVAELDAIALTTAIVMIEGATDLVRTAETRLAATHIGVAVSMIVMLVLRPYAAKASRKYGQTHY